MLPLAPVPVPVTTSAPVVAFTFVKSTSPCAPVPVIVISAPASSSPATSRLLNVAEKVSGADLLSTIVISVTVAPFTLIVPSASTENSMSAAFS